MNAEEARKITNKAREDNLNPQRIEVLDLIKFQSLIGEYCVDLDGESNLQEEDYVFFEKLGYKVERGVREQYIDVSGRVKDYYGSRSISWGTNETN